MTTNRESYVTDSHSKSNRELLACYQQSISSGQFQNDPEQEPIVRALQSLYNQIITEEKQPEQQQGLRGLIARIGNVFDQPQTQIPIKGLYIWGGVGRGKTYLVNLFYQCLPIKKKLRLHFHRFMQIIHEEMQALENTEDPLRHVAKHFADQARVICLDEMHVIDITDAMLLGRLFEHLYSYNVVIVSTSNFAPDDLYKDGLQRQQFLPAIEHIKKNNRVIKLEGNKDYRLEMLRNSVLYQVGSGELVEQRMEQQFNALAGIQLHRDRKEVFINQRCIPVVKWADSIIWFSFDALCNQPRSTEDYLQIGHFFHTILISDIPVMSAETNDQARRFINMIDAFYDLQVHLIVSAESEPEDLYTKGNLAFEFKRTASRLREMQSIEYLNNQSTQQTR